MGVDAIENAQLLAGSAAGLAKDTGGMGVVDDEKRLVLLSQFDDLRKRGKRAFHGEDAVGDDHLVARLARRFQGAPQVGYVAVFVAFLLRLGQADAVDDRGVIQLVGDDRVLLQGDRLEQAFIRIPARPVKNRVLGTEKPGDALFELAMNRLRAADEADGRQTIAVVALTFLSGFGDGGMVGQAEVVVRSQHDHFADAFDVHHRTLGRFHQQLALERASGGHLIELGLQRGNQRHENSSADLNSRGDLPRVAPAIFDHAPAVTVWRFDGRFE